MDTDDEPSTTSGWQVAGLSGMLGLIHWAARKVGSLTWAGRASLGTLLGWSLVVGLLYGQFWFRVLHPSGWALIAALLFAVISTLGTVVLGLVRWVSGPNRRLGAGLVLLGLVPVVILSGLIAQGISQFRRGHIEANVPFVLFAMTGVSLGELWADWAYPHRIETETLIMSYGDSVEDPEGDVKAMEEHIGRLHSRTHRGSRGKTRWVRGKVFGQQYLSVAGMALGSDRSPLSAVDLHEIGHAILYQVLTPDCDPAMVLAEGWAEAVSRDSLDLARGALSIRDRINACSLLDEAEWAAEAAGWDDAEGYRRLMLRVREMGPERFSYLRELTSPDWYHRDRGVIYPIGGAFASFVFRKHTPEQFVSLFLGSKPGNLDLMCGRIFQQTPEQLEAAFWMDLEYLIAVQAFEP